MESVIQNQSVYFNKILKAVKHETSYDKVNSWKTDKRLNISGYIETPEKPL